MPRIILTQPFIRHYAGSVFDLSDETLISDWPDDDRLREKQSFSDRHAYLLPDAGNGRPAELPVADTVRCPPDVFAGVDLHTGPCRLTSVQGENAHGQSLLQLDDHGAPAKNRLTLHASVEAISVTVLTRPEDLPAPAAVWHPDRRVVDLSACPPGFYLVRVEAPGQRFECTVIKCFPLVVEVERGSGRVRTQVTVW